MVVVITRSAVSCWRDTVSVRQRLAVLLGVLLVSGCAHTPYWVQPITVCPDGRVSGTTLSTGNPLSMTLETGQKVKLLLQPFSQVCAPESSKPVCTLEGRLLRLELSADREVTGLVVEPASIFVENFLEGSGSKQRKNLPVPAGEVRLAVGDIKAFFYKYYYVRGT